MRPLFSCFARYGAVQGYKRHGEPVSDVI